MQQEKIIKLTEAIEINPQNANAYYNRANAFKGLGKKEEAIQDYTKAIEINPQCDKAYCNRGTVFKDLGRKEEAIEDYSKAITINPLYADAYYNRGNASKGFGKKEEAIQDYTKAIEINPQWDKAYCNRGNVFKSLGRKEEAIKDYSKAIEINPQYANAYYNRAIVLKDLGRKEEAIKDYSKAIEINPQYANAFNNRGIALKGLGKKEEAIKDYSKAIEIDPQYANAYCNRGNALDDLGKKEEAIKDYSKAIQINPQDDKAYWNRGIALESLRRNEEAYKDYKTAYRVEPNDPLYNIQLGAFLLFKGEQQKAYEFFTQGFKLTQSLSNEDKEKFNLSDSNISYIYEINTLIKKTLSENQQKFRDEIQSIEDKFKLQIGQQIIKDDNNENKNNDILKGILQKLNQLEQKNNSLNQQLQKDQQSMFNIQHNSHQLIDLKQDENRYIYYQSLYWRLYNYLSVCKQLSTDLFLKNRDVVIDNDQERIPKIISKVVQQIEKQPIVGTVITIISSALVEFGFSYHIDYKFNKIAMNLTQIVQERCDSGNHIDEQIQLAIIIQSKQLREITQDQQFEDQRLLQHVKEIQKAERESGVRQAENPYWKQGIVDTLKILRNLLLNFKQIQQDKEKELHIVILESLKYESIRIVQVGKTSRKCFERCQNNCQIQ